MKNVLADGRFTPRGGGGGTHRLHMYPTPGRAWGKGVVGGCGRAVPVRHPSPFTPLLHNLTHSLHLKYTCSKLAVSNSSSLYTLFYSVIYNSVVQIYYAISQAVLYSSNFNFKTVIKFVFSLAFQFLFQTVLLQKLANDPKIGRKERKKSKKRWRMEQSRRRKNQSLILP